MGYFSFSTVSMKNVFMILFLLELIMMIAAPVMHIWLSTLYLNGRITLSILTITLISLVTGITLPILASYIDILNLPPDIKCATGSAGFAAIGISLTIIIIPLSAITFYIIGWYKRRKLNNTSGEN